MIDLKAACDKYEADNLKFDQIENPPSRRPDLCAFLLLDRLVPGVGPIVSAVGYDDYWIGVSLETLANVATEADILYLVRCGVCYHDQAEGLYFNA